MRPSEVVFANKFRNSRNLVVLVATLFVTLVVWSIRKSAVTSDLGVDGAAVPDLNLFQRLNWLWLILFAAPAVYIGTARIRTVVLCGVFAYGIGTLLGWCAAELGSVLSNPLLRPGLWVGLAQALGFGAAYGALFVGVVRLCRYLTIRLTGKR
jgi:hypothetical protein